MTVMRTVTLCRFAWSLLLLAACRQTDVLTPTVTARAPKDSTPASRPEVQVPQTPGTITVLVLPYENGCRPAYWFCEPARSTSISLDSASARTFSAAGPVEFSGLAAGKHVVRNISGYFGGPVVCGFWFADASDEITVVLEEGKSLTVPLHFECF